MLETLEAIPVLNVKWHQMWAVVQGGSGFPSQSYHHDLEQGIASPSLQMSLLPTNSIIACTETGLSYLSVSWF